MDPEPPGAGKTPHPLDIRPGTPEDTACFLEIMPWFVSLIAFLLAAGFVVDDSTVTWERYAAMALASVGIACFYVTGLGWLLLRRWIGAAFWFSLRIISTAGGLWLVGVAMEPGCQGKECEDNPAFFAGVFLLLFAALGPFVSAGFAFFLGERNDRRGDTTSVASKP